MVTIALRLKGLTYTSRNCYLFVFVVLKVYLLNMMSSKMILNL